MNENQDRRNAGLVAGLLLGWELCAAMAKGAARIFLEKERPARVPGVPLTPEEAGRIEAEEKRKAITGAVLLVGSVAGWRLGQLLLRKGGEWLLKEAQEPRSSPGARRVEVAAGGRRPAA